MPFLGKFPTQIVDPEVDIDGGAIDGVTIGATTASAATVTTLTSGNITTTGYIAGPSTFTIDPAAVGDNTGTLVVAGNLQVDGTTTTINSTTMTVDDLNITLASGAANAAAANGAGITVDGASATLTYNGTNDDWNFNKALNITGNLTSTGIDDNATSTAITISSSQNVGIGTNPSPALGTGLHIRGSGYANLTLQKSASNVGHALEFTDENNAIQYRIGTNFASGGQNLLFAYGSTPAIGMTLNSSGNVGIGTAPSAPLHVKVTEASIGETDPLVRFERFTTGDNHYLDITVDNSTNMVGFQSTGTSNGGFTFGGASSDLLVINSSGNVGIGTTSPNAQLHVLSSGNGEIEVERSGGALINLQAQAGVGVIGTDSNHGLRLKTNGGVRATITASGNVGIGTTSPEASLHVEGAIQIGRDTGAAQYQYINFGGNASGDEAWQIGRSPNTGGVGGAGNFYFYDLDNAATRMVITTGGNVGIGTTSPSKPVHVVSTNSGATTTPLLLQNNQGAANGAVEIRLAPTGYPNDIGSTARWSAIRAINGGTGNPTELAFLTNSTSADPVERMRIDSSGNLLVGHTGSIYNNINTTSTIGSSYSTNGEIFACSNQSSGVMFLNRKSSDGAIATFRKDGTTVGSIASLGGTSLRFNSQGATGILQNGGSDKYTWSDSAFASANDNYRDLGSASYRWKDVYLSGGAYLGGTGAANHLEDYEEGTWLPTITGNSGASGQSYSTQRGRYRKIGNVVHITFDAQLTNAGSISGTYMVLGGLPFSGDGQNVGGGIVTTYSSGWGSGLVEPILAYMSGSLCYLMEGGSTGSDYILVSNNHHSSSSRLIGWGVIIVPA